MDCTWFRQSNEICVIVCVDLTYVRNWFVNTGVWPGTVYPVYVFNILTAWLLSCLPWKSCKLQQCPRLVILCKSSVLDVCLALTFELAVKAWKSPLLFIRKPLCSFQCHFHITRFTPPELQDIRKGHSLSQRLLPLYLRNYLSINQSINHSFALPRFVYSIAKTF